MSRHVTYYGAIVNPLFYSPALWLDFSDATKLFDATSGGSTPTAGTGIARVEDKSGNARHFTQSTSGNRPTYQTGVYNGHSIARFDGTNDRLSLGSSNLFRNISGGTIYAVRFWNGSPTIFRTVFSIGTTAATRASITAGSVSGKSNTGGRRLDADSYASISSTNNVSTSVLELDTAVFDYTNSDLYLYRNGSLEASNTSFQTGGNTSNTAAFTSMIGSGVGGVDFFLGDIAEILVYHTAHDATTRQRIRNYLRYKWGF